MPSSTTSSSPAATARDKFVATRREMASALIERDDEIDLVLTALIAKEHVLLVGPPGCAKSLLLDSLLAWAGGAKFAILLTKYTVPEEVVGPVSLAGLKSDRYLRITAGKLPEADFVYLDEVFKASSAILNTLLRLLNERTFDAGEGSRRKFRSSCASARRTNGRVRRRARNWRRSSTVSVSARASGRS
jgi:MoxR-like ATPase